MNVGISIPMWGELSDDARARIERLAGSFGTDGKMLDEREAYMVAVEMYTISAFTISAHINDNKKGSP